MATCNPCALTAFGRVPSDAAFTYLGATSLNAQKATACSLSTCEIDVCNLEQQYAVLGITEITLIPPNVLTPVIWAQQSEGSLTGYDFGTGIWTAPEDGIYSFSANVRWFGYVGSAFTVAALRENPVTLNPNAEFKVMNDVVDQNASYVVNAVMRVPKGKAYRFEVETAADAPGRNLNPDRTYLTITKLMSCENGETFGA